VRRSGSIPPLMSAVTEFRNFWKRRMKIPVDGSGLVLDIGSGDKPHWRADVLLDYLPGKDSAAQRSGYDSARVTRPLFHGDAADMPFADQSFDYVICSHLLEHVLDPAGVLEEMMRVAKAGYIEVPEAASAKIVDFPTHLWWVRMVDGVLDFEPKRARSFDPEIEAYLERSGLHQSIEQVLNSRLEHRVISLRWEGTIAYNVRGPIEQSMLDQAAAATAVHGGKSAMVATTLTGAAAMIDHRRHHREVTFNEIVKPALRVEPDHALTAQIYRVAGE
jgi:SAM-dependent methyltransferase